MNAKKIGFTALVSFISAFAAIAVFNYFGLNRQQVKINEANNIPARLAAYIAPTGGYSNQPVDFRFAAAASTPCVVHIKSTYKAERTSLRGNQLQDPFGNGFFQFFQGPNPFQQQQQPQVATGSGVIVSKDGYIVTNNHVVDEANEIEVVLNNNKTYKAKVIGKDPDTDIALVKIEGASDLPSIQFANSDSVMVGEWVLAVGNPFNLSSTVTAGIVSAKGRNINLHGEDEANGTSTAIESFIQTDAAVNPGNSGGALVNMNGDLVGINTAIASPTGSYAGYSFAVPSNIVRKVILDLEKYGISQRGFLGVTIRTMDDASAKEVNFDKPYGVFVESVNKGSASEDAGLKHKDVITKINGFAVNSSPELQEQVAQYRPGDKITVEYIRDGKTETTTVTLKNKYNSTASVDNTKDVLNALGIKVENLTDAEKRNLGVAGGVKITDMKDGKLSQFTDIKKGFVITQIDDEAVNNAQDFTNIMKDKSGKVLLEGIYPNRPMSYLYAFKM
jgi:Do/DeqQ family serine protease